MTAFLLDYVEYRGKSFEILGLLLFAELMYTFFTWNETDIQLRVGGRKRTSKLVQVSAESSSKRNNININPNKIER